jgi:integrase
MEEVQKILSVCSRLREKVIVLLLQSTGMRIGAIHTLKVGYLFHKPIEQGKVYKIEVYSGTSDSYYCYCNIEAAQCIDEYLKERTDDSEILSHDSPLIRNLYNSLNVKIVKPLSNHAIRYTLDHILEKSGIRKTFQFTGEAKRAKGFRKLYKSLAEDSGMKPINVELTHGHSIGISGHYYRPLESQVLEDYMSHAADALTIDPKQRLIAENQELRAERSQEMIELRALKKEMDGIKYLLGYSKKPTALLNHLEQEAWRQIQQDEEREES